MADIQEAALEYQLAIASNPANLIQGMRQANAALVKYAKSSKECECGPTRLGIFWRRLKTWRTSLPLGQHPRDYAQLLGKMRVGPLVLSKKS